MKALRGLAFDVTGKRPTRTLTLPLTVSSPISVLPLPEAASGWCPVDDPDSPAFTIS